MHETGCSGLVHWDDPEGWNGEGGWRGIQDGGHMYTHVVKAHVIPLLVTSEESEKENLLDPGLSLPGEYKPC